MSVSDDIRRSVQRSLEKNTERNAFSTLKNEQNGPKRMLKSVAAVYRSLHSSGSITLSDTQKKDYNAVLDHLAELRGISKKNGSYTDDQYKNELSIDNVLGYTADLYMTSKAPADDKAKKACIDEINKNILDVYENNAEEAKPAQNIASASAVYMTVDEFCQASPEEREAYLANRDPVDRKAYEDALSKINDNNIAPEVKITNQDPDWAHKTDDDDIKIQEGDIIQYLMKDVILASGEFVINKTGGTVGALGYEGVSAFFRKMKEVKRDLRYGSGKKDDKGGAATADKTPKDLFHEKLDNRERFIAETSEKELETWTKLDPDKVYGRDGTTTLADIERKLVKHMYKFDEVRDEDSKKFLIYLQAGFDTKHIDFMVAELGENRRNEITEKFKKFTEARDAACGSGPEPDPKDYFKDENGNPQQDLIDSFKRTEDKTILYTQIQHEENKFRAQGEVFAHYYADYVLSEQFRTHPDFIKNDEEIQKLIDKAENEAAVVFWQAQQDRRKQQNKINNGEIISDEELIPSNDDLIEMVKVQRQDSIDKADHDVSPDEKVEDNTRKHLELPTTEEGFKTLAEEVNSQITAERLANLALAQENQKQKALKGDASATDEQRNIVDRKIERLEKVSKDTSAKNIKVNVSPQRGIDR